LPMISRSPFRFRVNIMIFAGVLGLQATWLLAAELIRPTFPGDKVTEEKAAAVRSAAAVAASLGWVRGDLWADSAVALWSGLATKIEGASPSQMGEPIQQARAAAERAAKLAPHDSRVWLLLAALDWRFDWIAHKVSGPLKMSYYTGPNELALTPLRIHIATSSDSITDPETQNLVAGEIRTIILHQQNLKPSIVAAYRDASPEGKEFIEAAIGDLDKDFLATIRAVRGRQ
jgi:hypothetical protein